MANQIVFTTSHVTNVTMTCEGTTNAQVIWKKITAVKLASVVNNAVPTSPGPLAEDPQPPADCTPYAGPRPRGGGRRRGAERRAGSTVGASGDGFRLT